MTQFTIPGKYFSQSPKPPHHKTTLQKHRKAPQYPTSEAEYRGTLPFRSLMPAPPKIQKPPDRNPEN